MLFPPYYLTKYFKQKSYKQLTEVDEMIKYNKENV